LAGKVLVSYVQQMSDSHTSAIDCLCEVVSKLNQLSDGLISLRGSAGRSDRRPLAWKAATRTEAGTISLANRLRPVGLEMAEAIGFLT